MTNNLATIKEMTGTRIIKGKRVPRSIGKIRDVVFYPDKKCVAGFVTKQSDFLFLIRRKGHFVSVKGYYLYEDLVFVRHEKQSSDKAAYKALGLSPNDCIKWLGLPVITEDGQKIGVVSDVCFVHQSGEVQSIVSSSGAIGKLLQGTRTIPTELIKGYYEADSTDLVPFRAGGAAGNGAGSEAGGAAGSKMPLSALLVSNEVLDIALDTDKTLVSKTGKQVSTIAQNVGLDTAALSEKTKSVADAAETIVSEGAAATRNQLKKTKGMFSAFKDEYNKARHGD